MREIGKSKNDLSPTLIINQVIEEPISKSVRTLTTCKRYGNPLSDILWLLSVTGAVVSK